MHRDATRNTFRQRCAPLRFVSRQCQHVGNTRMFGEQLATKRNRVFPRRLGQIVDHGFHHERGMGVPHRAPPQHRHAGLRRVQTRLHVWNVVRRVGDTFDTGRVNPALDHHRLKRGTRHNRLTNNGVIPADNFSGRVDASYNAMHKHGPVVAALHIVFTRPHGLHRHFRFARDFNRFDNVVRCRIGASPEATACKHGVQFHLLGLQSCHLRSGCLIDGLKLRADPDFAAIGFNAHRAIQRLHRRMREKRHLIFGSHCFGGAL